MSRKSEMHFPNAVCLTLSLALGQSPDKADMVSHEQGFCLTFSLTSSTLVA